MRLCINTRDELTVSLSIVAPLYNRNQSSNKKNPFHLVHLPPHLGLMCDCTKKGQGGLGSGGWNKQPGFALSLPPVFPLSLSQRAYKVCFGVQLQLVYSLSKQTQTSEFSNIVLCVLAPCFGEVFIFYFKFLITELRWEKLNNFLIHFILSISFYFFLLYLLKLLSIHLFPYDICSPCL